MGVEIEGPVPTKNVNGKLISNLMVKQGEPELVAPAGETYKGPYGLSNLDLNLVFAVSTIYCFRLEERGNEDAGKVLKEALRKVLLHYYPLAGRLATDVEGKLIIDCTGEGAVFVEADANCRMEEIGDIITKTDHDPHTLGKLVYDVPGAKNILEMPPLVAQVTKFSCGGFVLGLCVNHCMVDGSAAVKFVSSWGETARGLGLSIVPFTDRTILKSRNPPKIEYLHQEFLEIEDRSGAGDLNQQDEMLCRSFFFEPEKLEELKKKAMEDGTIDRCTTFEALSAFIWRARTKSLSLLPDQDIKLLLVVDVANKLQPPLPQGYFGNGVAMASVICQAGKLVEKPFSFAVGRVQDAIKMVTDRYLRSSIDYFEVTRPGHCTSSTLVITSWTRLPFHTADFGWGESVWFGPADLPGDELILFLAHGKDRKTVRVLVGLPASAMKIFQQELKQD